MASLTKSIVALLALLVINGYPPAVNRYDGHWWLEASKREQKGFLDGVQDCLMADAGEVSFRQASTARVLPLITEEYQRPAKVATAVLDLFRRLAPVQASQPRPQPKLPPGDVRPRVPEAATEVQAGRHGIYVGGYWALIEDIQRRGFIEGYLECHHALPNARATYSRPADWYVSKISDWYFVRPAGEEAFVPTEKDGIPVADVLLRFRDAGK